MAAEAIGSLFAKDISRRIEEVIKVDQADEEIILDEISEYVVTDSIRAYYDLILERYRETPNKPHEGIAVWVSGFFGSGKSSFAKFLGLALEDRTIKGQGAAELFGQRTGDPKIQVLLKNIGEHVPSDAVIFDVSTDRGIRTGDQRLTEIMYRLFLQRLGYARDLDLAELEITLEAEERLEEFKAAYRGLFEREWDEEKRKVVLAVQQASRVMHALEPDTYPTADSWRQSAMRRADVSPGLLAERCKELMRRRRPGRSLVFVVDEVGQFVARDVGKMLDLQAIVQSLGRVGRGRMWIVVTSQEKLTELVGGLDDRRVELARLMDRFPLQVHLEPSDISEVTSKRVLAKNAAAEKVLRELFSQHRGRLVSGTRLTAEFRLPELTKESFVDLYPLLPYQVDLIINVVSGLRTQGGATKHVGGANRTIIKLAQQLLIHPDVRLADAAIGALATIDQIYDLVSGNIASEVRGKIDAIRREVAHLLAQPVAKAICLLQYVQSVHRTAENIAAALHPAVDADSRLSEVKAALEELVRAQKVRLGDDGYRIPSPVEDDWERQRTGLSPKPADRARILEQAVEELWKPQPTCSFLQTKVFKAGLFLNGRQLVEGDVAFHLALADQGKELSDRLAEMRTRSQSETKSLFWVGGLDQAIDREIVEVHRSREIIKLKERSAQTRDESALVAEEKRRLSGHEGELRRRVRRALLSGSIFFRGNDRSPDDTAAEIRATAEQVLDQALPEVFDRFHEAAARTTKQDLDALMINENLRGLPPVFTRLNLLHDEGGKPVFNTDGGPLREILARIENRASYGEPATGRSLTDEFSREPFGWDFDVVRLLVIALLRAGKIEVTCQGKVIESALSLDARNSFPNNNLFRQASFRPKEGLDFPRVVDAYTQFKEAFGEDIPELEQSAVAAAIRGKVAECEAELQRVHNTLVQNALPGADVLASALDTMRAIRAGREDQAILAFNACHAELKEAIRRGGELAAKLHDPQLHDLRRARDALRRLWPEIRDGAGPEDPVRRHAEELEDLLSRESFFRELPAIDQHARAVETAFRQKHDEAAWERADAYAKALETLRATPGWNRLDADQQARISGPLTARATADGCDGASIAMLREQAEACGTYLQKAVDQLLQVIEGNRVARVSAGAYFAGGVESEEQLEQALVGLRQECLELIGAGKKVFLQ